MSTPEPMRCPRPECGALIECVLCGATPVSPSAHVSALEAERDALLDALDLVVMSDIHGEPALRTRNDIPMQIPRAKARRLAALLRAAGRLPA